MRFKNVIAVAAVCLMAGCATTDTGITPIGGGQYMLSKLGGMTDFSGGTVKAELYKEAADFCGKAGKQLTPINSTSENSGYGKHASAEIQFRCD